MTPTLHTVEPKPPRWEPTAVPQDIIVPGLDTTASVNDQVEQIEQLITIKLQNIDTNFSKIQQIMANRILPAVKRYAVGTEPIRDSAKFWITFFEQAAQIRVPVYDEYNVQETRTDSMGENSEEQSSEEQSTEHEKEGVKSFDPNVTSSEVSFSLGQTAISSTPARRRLDYGEEPTPSWSASIESPLVRLDRDIQSLAEEERAVAVPSTSRMKSQYEDTSDADITQKQIPATSAADLSALVSLNKAKGKSPAEPLLHGILRRNADAATNANRTALDMSPLKVKGKTPILKSMNPYLPADIKPSDWKGVVDLTNPHAATPGKHTTSSTKRLFDKQATRSQRPTTPKLDVDDESFDEGLGMSPPIMMDFARLPKAKTPLLGRTPRKEAAERITESLVNAERSSSTFSSARINAIFTRSGVGAVGGIESSMSTVPSPPSLSKYTTRRDAHGAEISHSLADASLESMMRRVGLDVSGFEASSSSTTMESGESYGTGPMSTFLPPATSQASTSQAHSNSQMPVIDFSRVRVDDDEYGVMNASMDSDDSFEEANDTANPSAAFLMAAQRPSYDDDDSFDSNDNDSIDFADPGAMGNPHPFGDMMAVQEGDSFDDSFDNDPVFDQQTEEETLFGVPPAQRLQAHAVFRTRMSSAHLQLHGQGLLDDTLGIGQQMGQAGRIEETPTPTSGSHGQ